MTTQKTPQIACNIFDRLNPEAAPARVFVEAGPLQRQALRDYLTRIAPDRSATIWMDTDDHDRAILCAKLY